MRVNLTEIKLTEGKRKKNTFLTSTFVFIRILSS